MAKALPGSQELKRLGGEIRSAREARKISLRQFAPEVELSASYYSKVERGEVLAEISTYERICKALGLDPEKVFPKALVIDSEAVRLFEEAYRANAGAVKGELRKIAKGGGKR